MASSDEFWWSRSSETDGVHIIHVDLAPRAAHQEGSLAWLARSERIRLRRFRVERPRRQFALCRSALRANLCEELAETTSIPLVSTSTESRSPSWMRRRLPMASTKATVGRMDGWDSPRDVSWTLTPRNAWRGVILTESSNPYSGHTNRERSRK